MLNEGNAAELARIFAHIHVSLDGATAEVHDRIRGRAGAFEGALAALAALDRVAAARRAAGEERPRFGLDTVVVRSNFPQLPAICAEIAPRFPELSFLRMGAAVPSGPANAERYAEEELLSAQEPRLDAVRTGWPSRS